VVEVYRTTCLNNKQKLSHAFSAITSGYDTLKAPQLINKLKLGEGNPRKKHKS